MLTRGSVPCWSSINGCDFCFFPPPVPFRWYPCELFWPQTWPNFLKTKKIFKPLSYKNWIRTAAFNSSVSRLLHFFLLRQVLPRKFDSSLNLCLILKLKLNELKLELPYGSILELSSVQKPDNSKSVGLNSIDHRYSLRFSSTYNFLSFHFSPTLAHFCIL